MMHLQIMPAIRSLKPLIRGAMLYQSLSKALIFSPAAAKRSRERLNLD